MIFINFGTFYDRFDLHQGGSLNVQNFASFWLRKGGGKEHKKVEVTTLVLSPLS
jgi:hypothetical protein